MILTSLRTMHYNFIWTYEKDDYNIHKDAPPTLAYRNPHKNKNPLKPMAPRGFLINTETYTDRVPMGVLGCGL